MCMEHSPICFGIVLFHYNIKKKKGKHLKKRRVGLRKKNLYFPPKMATLFPRKGRYPYLSVYTERLFPCVLHKDDPHVV